MRQAPLLILGAGPAGLAAASEARAQGIEVLLLDENPAPGGQVHRAVGGFYRPEAGAPGADQAREGLRLIQAAAASGAECRFGATLWAVQEDGVVSWSEGGRAHQVQASVLLLCPGATERALPIPGWTLPGVMGVGAAQILLKTAGLLPEGRVWLAGQGPLLWLYAAQLLDKGVRPAGILDLSPPGMNWRAAWHLPMALRAPGYLAQGLGWMWRIRRAGIPVIRAREVAALGEGRLSAIAVDGRTFPADWLLLHDGVVPNTQVTRALPGCAHIWDQAQASFRPVLDAWGNTSLEGLLVAGDGGGIGGARAAALSGRIAALEAARWLGFLTADQRDAMAGPLLHRRAAELAPRGLLDAIFPPLPMARVADATVVCRCEEITAGRVRAAVALGVQGPNQVKAFLRAGMGACQGRVCGPAVHALMAEARGVDPGALEPLRTRFPTKPVTVGELAGLAGGE
ncbi:NAD(P)/FAD-dependent oxidoreductase [Sediminicoccus sp. KRV36]|uniref:FAD/NAD(P)-dependent oxidoreductase n=1 Tax=Sediminicoccus sp. KRV36 TaxID=3133721 RepID=UPI00200FF768|nr:NAD(P)/FAD-dependent oxidoreductase [Sediminicoccus rosea]UPY39237.1 NAD(P)/FAD-dependent oxidoreductase [Sediminicoccus rosea]